jgi:Rps23 Pro-64 3,4-dihydroxylase Tpa1-like proline 4-hydroxylase
VRTRELDGRRLFIVDELFDAGMVKLLHESFMRMPFTQTEIDSEESRHIRHWKFDFDLETVDRHPIFLSWRNRILQKTAQLVSASSLPVQRIYCNSTLYGDHQHSHTDSAEGTTALYFANAHWEEDWQGETIFYESNGEAQHAIAPRPGRLVVFPSCILHRGGVPSRTCMQSRLTVAFKFGSAPSA